MAADEKSTPKTSAKTLTDLKASLAALLAAWPGADNTDIDKSAPDPGEQAVDMGARARMKYDSMIRWVIGVFAAIGLLIFGSLPFTDVADMYRWGWLGLAAAGVGVITILWATTVGLEPQDASLGELQSTFESFQNNPQLEVDSKNKKQWRVKRGYLRPNSRVMAQVDFSNTLMRRPAETQAHLGPGITNVVDLIDCIGQLEAEIAVRETGWKFISPAADNPELKTPTRNATAESQLLPPLAAESISGLDKSKAYHDAAYNGVDAQTKALIDRSERLIDQLGKAPDIANQHPDLRGLASKATAATLTSLEPYLGRVDAQFSKVSEWDRKNAELNALTAARDRYLRHRELVLNESTVAQLRGTFRFVRSCLSLGALLTLAGGMIYAAALVEGQKRSANVESEQLTPVTLTVKPNTPAWNDLKACHGNEEASDVVVAALLRTSSDADAQSDGPFTATVTDPRCPAQITVDDGQASYSRI